MGWGGGHGARGTGHGACALLNLEAGGARGMCIFEPWLHMTCACFHEHMVQIMASLDTWLPAAMKKKTANDRR